ncbi:MAG TPA: hypothetical protein VJT73_12910 [Polyangiaceae bacterium]|nr:hypothetical protein [Polyangiaceae bacterium]
MCGVMAALLVYGAPVVVQAMFSRRSKQCHYIVTALSQSSDAERHHQG